MIKGGQYTQPYSKKWFENKRRELQFNAPMTLFIGPFVIAGGGGIRAAWLSRACFWVLEKICGWHVIE